WTRPPGPWPKPSRRTRTCEPMPIATPTWRSCAKTTPDDVAAGSLAGGKPTDVERGSVFHATGFGLANVPDSLTGNCGSEPGIACRLARGVRHSNTAPHVVQAYLG